MRGSGSAPVPAHAARHAVFAALAYCHHDLKLLHRDLKPANVFLGGGGGGELVVKLGDFGISKVMQASCQLAQTQCGTPLYMSPEICRGHGYARAADVWALGCVLLELMTLQAPWVEQMNPRAAGNLSNLLRHISSQRLRVDQASLRAVSVVNTFGLTLRRTCVTDPTCTFSPDVCAPRCLQRYSEELCALLLALIAKDAKARPTMRELLGWPHPPQSPRSRSHLHRLCVPRGPERRPLLLRVPQRLLQRALRDGRGVSD